MQCCIKSIMIQLRNGLETTLYVTQINTHRPFALIAVRSLSQHLLCLRILLGHDVAAAKISEMVLEGIVYLFDVSKVGVADLEVFNEHSDS